MNFIGVEGGRERRKIKKGEINNKIKLAIF